MSERRYSVSGNCINTASATLPIGNLLGATTIRPSIYEVIIGSDATPAETSVKYAFQRQTTAGTWAGAGGAAITPQGIDPGNTVASACAANQGICSAGPTLTASTFFMNTGLHQRATLVWKAYDEGARLVIPATANNGLSLMSLVVNGAGAVNAVFCIEFGE